jgi:Ferredoxin-like domain in Api92-like protein
MPNFIQNRLTILGDNYESIKSDMASDEKDVDFCKILPIPTGLLNINNPDLRDDIFLRHFTDKSLKDEPFIKVVTELKDMNDVKTNKSFLQGLSNFLMYGHVSEHSWVLEHWGTKWEAQGLFDERTKGREIYFQTAWTTPFSLIHFLSKKYPNNTFKIEFADENAGINCGVYELKNGEALVDTILGNETREAYDLSFDFYPDLKDYYQLVNDNYEYFEPEE